MRIFRPVFPHLSICGGVLAHLPGRPLSRGCHVRFPAGDAVCDVFSVGGEVVEEVAHVYCHR